MRVADIPREKGTIVIQISKNDSVADAAAWMRRKDVGSLVVSNSEGVPIGVVSERDIVRIMGTQSMEPMHVSVGDIVSPNFVSCTKETPTKKLLEIMTAKKVRHVPVIENGKLCGIVSIGDVVKHHLENTRLEVGALRDRAGLPETHYGSGGALF